MTALSDLIARTTPLRDGPAWRALETHRDETAQLHLRQLLDEPGRYAAFSCGACDLVLDFSRNVMTGQTLELLGLILVQCMGVLDDQQAASVAVAWVVGSQYRSPASLNRVGIEPVQQTCLAAPSGAA